MYQKSDHLLCNHNCSDFILEICTARFRVPYVCNGCETLGKCSLLKNIYDAEHAHIKAHEAISQSRSGLCLSEDEVSRLNRIISPLVQNGQSIHQIYVTQEDISLMMNHINSYKRKKLNNRSPYETFSFYHGEEVLAKLKCAPVEASDIILKPGLLKK